MKVTREAALERRCLCQEEPIGPGKTLKSLEYLSFCSL